MNTFIKILIFIGIVVLMSCANAQDFNYDKTYTHDNTFCRVDGKRIEIEVKSLYQYTALDEAEYGEDLFVIADGNKTQLKFNSDNIGRYRLLKGTNDYCTKALSIRLNESELALFFLRDNRPFNDQLLYMVYDFKKNIVLRTSETIFLTEKAQVKNNRLHFLSKPEVIEKDSGIVQIEGKPYYFSEKAFLPWVNFNGVDFILDLERSFEDFEGKKFFKDLNSFVQFSTLNQLKLNQFTTYKIAVNHELKRTCISFDENVWKCN
ncbi:hypothetical protein [Peredibacter starrii]|uniref:Lipoprotein n=1 Tax=Peredibacter starrii TaxID=28202 RepID=A0AAX4HU94_9BACT|nr:hypothetical protein [Peredibacter starrii]WPU66842.1 hypothetical protein SOO65_08780 [Peredibacter starrii]